MRDSESRKTGMGFVSTLTLIFVVLKLLNLIEWSWIWVFSPVWISVVLLVIVFGGILIFGRIKKGKW